MSGFFDTKNDRIEQKPIITPERRKALDLLSEFGQTGNLNGFVAGQGADLSGFDFSPTDIEASAGNRLKGLIDSDSPAGIGTARDVLTGFATSEFDLDDPGNAFAAFRRQLARGIGDANDVLNREAAITGNRFGSRIINEKGDLAARQSDILSSEIGRLFEASQGRKMAAAGGLADLEGLNQQIEQSKIAQAFQLGSLKRDLKNQQAQLKLNDFLRRQNERLQSITGGLGTVAQTPIPFGVKTLTKESPSTFMSMLGEFSPAVGSYNTHKYGYTTNQSSLSELSDILAQAYTGGSA